ncbi:MAG: molybdate ABC transporter permease subunit [Deltaproteobacteria bacterium]|nr:molybdate ABC transporter permease subunit [Deltaproteobacteria bacterium]
MDAPSLLVTLQLATATTVTLAVVGIPAAWWLSQARFRGRALVDALLALPLVLPPTVLGFYLLTVLGPRGPLGGLYGDVTGRTLPFTFEGVLLGSVLYNVPFALRPFVAAFSSVDRRYIEAAACLGAGSLRIFHHVVLPLSRAGVASGLVLTFAHSVGEFGVVLMLGGNIPGVTRTASVAVYDHVQALDYGGAAAMSALLLVFSFTALAVTEALQRRAPGVM